MNHLGKKPNRHLKIEHWGLEWRLALSSAMLHETLKWTEKG